ncbi:hypothetical protein T265_10812 [Opisthorchis viverrini]|uniref:Uncharacterized protein n=1 Tax=Opisthorchis viverrini TaxID=6198 RepID=A0A074Z177_OPIVI|nr:hypothetical protein T265_10812 [Opisthorchis viverrini]KER20698.1 hypothetical protein T265_10812 [Opisthorchis viverrini]
MRMSEDHSLEAQKLDRKSPRGETRNGLLLGPRAANPKITAKLMAVIGHCSLESRRYHRSCSDLQLLILTVAESSITEGSDTQLETAKHTSQLLWYGVFTQVRKDDNFIHIGANQMFWESIILVYPKLRGAGNT